MEPNESARHEIVCRLNRLAELYPRLSRLPHYLSLDCNPSPISPVGQGMIELLALMPWMNFDKARNLVREELRVSGSSPKEVAERIASSLGKFKQRRFKGNA
jgi:hypothetical protein